MSLIESVFKDAQWTLHSHIRCKISIIVGVTVMQLAIDEIKVGTVDIDRMVFFNSFGPLLLTSLFERVCVEHRLFRGSRGWF